MPCQPTFPMALGLMSDSLLRLMLRCCLCVPGELLHANSFDFRQFPGTGATLVAYISLIGRSRARAEGKVREHQLLWTRRSHFGPQPCHVAELVSRNTTTFKDSSKWHFFHIFMFLDTLCGFKTRVLCDMRTDCVSLAFVFIKIDWIQESVVNLDKQVLRNNKFEFHF